MDDQGGRTLRLSPSRRFICDLVYFAKKAPLCVMQRTMQLRDVAALRSSLPNRPGWCSLFTKAYGIVAAARPELRRAYIPWPWPHLYEHPFSVASIGIEREIPGETIVFFTRIRGPEKQPLTFIESHLRRCKEEPVESFGIYRQAQRVSRLPLPLRRLMWSFGLYSSGARRARSLGTFGVSVVAGLGAAGLGLLTPLSTAVNYGVMTADGSMDVRLTYDHRVMDGGTAARAVGELEAVLKGEVSAEMRDMARSAA
jgi:hypothetical protein